MERKILGNSGRIGIVNRGEAAVRVIRALREYNRLYGTGFESVAFYQDVEKDALYVQEADYARPLSGFSEFKNSKQSPYLNKPLMTQALKESACVGAWVGWGFISEDSEFAAMLEREGVVLLGPSANAMELLGDKIQAKELADNAQVPILPWSRGPVESYEAAIKVAEEVGYPVIVKAANAGGGRGIRFVFTPDELAAQYKSAVDETLRITGNTVVFIERLVEKGRHLEVQVLADRLGNVRTFGVRDCSVQRKNQKIIEETPPPQFSDATIAEMEAAAGRLIKAASYDSAGTVEFLYDLKYQQFYFMEVNTRLQVEHPITETLYGVDLVHGQIMVAQGKSVKELPSSPRGVVIEVRLNAEDPDREFRPAPGLVSRVKFPAGPGIRIDSGIEQGVRIPSEFDSMVAKVIAAGPDRPSTIARLERALDELKIKIEGGTTNRAFLLELLKRPEIRAGGVHTRFVEEYLAAREQRERPRWDVAILACACEQYLAHVQEEYLNFSQQIFTAGQPRALKPAHSIETTLTVQGAPMQIKVQAAGDNQYLVRIGNHVVPLRYKRSREDAELEAGGKRYHVQIVERGDVLQCEVDGIPYDLEIESGGTVKAPSPALVLSVAVKPGQKVQKGAVLLTLEAMKMEMIVASPEDAVVGEVMAKPGEQVAAGQVLVKLEGEGQKGKEQKAAPQIDFGALSTSDAIAWDILAMEYLAAFNGYDFESSASAVVKAMEAAVSKNPALGDAYTRTVIKALSMFVEIERMFSNLRIESQGFARAPSYQELLIHYFKRPADREKGLPEPFLQSLGRTLAFFGLSLNAPTPDIGQAVFRIFKSHANLVMKQDLLMSALGAIERYKPASELKEQVKDLLDETAGLVQEQRPSLSDAAINTRYNLFDRPILAELRQEKRAKVPRIIAMLQKPGEHERLHEEIMDRLMSYGEDSIRELSAIASEGDNETSCIALEGLARRMNRDRGNVKVTIHKGDVAIAELQPQKGPGTRCLVASVTLASREKAIAALAARSDKNSEVLLFLHTRDRDQASGQVASDAAAAAFTSHKKPAALFCIAGTDSMGIGFRTYVPGSGGDLIESVVHTGFSPLAFRELRVDRLSNFSTKVLYSREGIHLIHGLGKDNPKDERLFALVEVETTRAEFGQDGEIRRMIGFESQFMDAVYALRVEQSRRKQRLHWNRIILSVRPILQISLDKLERFAAKFASRAGDLGVEKLVMYLRTPKPDTQELEEIELLIENIVENSFSLTTRAVSDTPLRTTDAYVAKVVRARQRNTVYPYEIVKMLTAKGSDFHAGGSFEEFDLAGDGEAGPAYQSVAGRAFGCNTGNIVFGLICNTVGGRDFTRVIILSDPTTDLGSLTELECRRVNAALDLAQDRGIPAEWIPISAGARIDMDSGTENLDWTAATLRRIIEFTQNGGELNIIVSGINVGAQSYWNAEGTMLMHTRGLLIMTEEASMLLTGKKALDFSGSVSAEDNVGIGGVERIMEPNGQAQIRVKDLREAWDVLFTHYSICFPAKGGHPTRIETSDPVNRDVGLFPYQDGLNQGFQTIGDVFSIEMNGERKKPFDIRQVLKSVCDQDQPILERWKNLKDGETAVVQEARIGGYAVGLIGIESKPLTRLSEIPHDGPESWSGGTLFPLSSKKVARGINAFSGRMPLVVLANLSGFDGSPESMRKLQLEYGAEIGRAVVNFKGPIVFVVVGRYHGGAYVVFSKALNANLYSAAIKGSYASVIGGAPAAAVVFPGQVMKDSWADPRIIEAQERLKAASMSQKDFDALFKQVHTEKQAALAQKFDQIHSVERAKKVGSIDEIITTKELRPFIIRRIEAGSKA